VEDVCDYGLIYFISGGVLGDELLYRVVIVLLVVCSLSTGAVMKNCTENGWSEMFPPYELACGHGLNDSFHNPNDSVILKWFCFCSHKS